MHSQPIHPAVYQSITASIKPCRTVLSVRIGERADQIDLLANLMDLPSTVNSPETAKRIEAEIAAIRAAGLGPAVSELLGMAADWGQAGQRLEVIGKAAGLLVFHIAGLTSLDPLEHGLPAESFLDIPEEAPNTVPGPAGKREWPVLGIRITPRLEDFMVYLRQRGYSFRTTHVAGESPCNLVVAGRRHPYGDRITPTLLITTGYPLPAAAALRPEEIAASLRDPRTYDLLASGDTDGIPLLEPIDMRETLRQMKPRSLASLAMAILQQRSDAGDPHAPPVYQEDVMLDLRVILGIGLADARRLLKCLCRSKSEANPYEAWFIKTAVSRGSSPSMAGDRWRKLLIDLDSMKYKAAAFEKAHQCLMAVYLKAHYPEDFLGFMAIGETTEGCLC